MSSEDRPSSSEAQRVMAREIVRGIDRLVQDARKETRPLEVDPFRSRLFEFFVTADGAGLISDDRSSPIPTDPDGPVNELDLSADNLCRLLAQHWGLDMAARESAALQTRLPKDQLETMRLLWSLMRMWMEWTYAWSRWEEFHDASSARVHAVPPADGGLSQSGDFGDESPGGRDDDDDYESDFSG